MTWIALKCRKQTLRGCRYVWPGPWVAEMVTAGQLAGRPGQRAGRDASEAGEEGWGWPWAGGCRPHGAASPGPGVRGDRGASLASHVHTTAYERPFLTVIFSQPAVLLGLSVTDFLLILKIS